MTIDCGFCGFKFELIAEVVKAQEVSVGELTRALMSAFGAEAVSSKRTEYMICCPRCKKAVGKFFNPMFGLY